MQLKVSLSIPNILNDNSITTCGTPTFIILVLTKFKKSN